MNESLEQWLEWAKRSHLGETAQLRAAADAAVEAVGRGATSEEAADAAREAARAARPDDRPRTANANASGYVEFSPAGITWEMAMVNAGRLLAGLPTDPKKMSNWERPESVSARSAMAQGWIAFARELTMHGRVPH